MDLCNQSCSSAESLLGCPFICPSCVTFMLDIERKLFFTSEVHIGTIIFCHFLPLTVALIWAEAHNVYGDQDLLSNVV